MKGGLIEVSDSRNQSRDSLNSSQSGEGIFAPREGILNAPVRPFIAYTEDTIIGIVLDPIIANNEAGKRVFKRKLPNDPEQILSALAPYTDAVIGIVIESTYNWYWLVDALMAEGYKVHLANPTEIK